MSVGLFVRGMAMGVAEVVPGVSGGTIAFVTGIYDELIATLARLDLRVLPMLWRQGPVAVWRECNLSFLAVLALGMAVSILLFARLMEAALAHAAPLVWAFFFGLIAYSVIVIGRLLPRRSLLLWAPVGLVLGVLLTRLTPTSGTPADWLFLLGGAIAISAWLLPAVSGSFLLLVLGLYEPVINAVNEFAVGRLLLFASGCALGLLAFSKLLRWLMTHHREPLLALLTGFMVGSLPKLWPWQLEGQLLLPGGYEQLSAEPAFALTVVPAGLLGALLLWLLGKLQR